MALYQYLRPTTTPAVEVTVLVLRLLLLIPAKIYTRKNFVLKKILQIREILNPRNVVPIRYVHSMYAVICIPRVLIIQHCKSAVCNSN